MLDYWTDASTVTLIQTIFKPLLLKPLNDSGQMNDVLLQLLFDHCCQKGKSKTFSNGSLGSCSDEERSKPRNVI